MNKLGQLKTVSALGALLFASSQAFAAPPTIPSSPPEASGPFPSDGLYVAVYDDTAGVSLIEYLGSKFSDFLPNLVTPEAGGTINYGTLDGWSMFSNSVGTNLRWEVFAVQNNGGNFTDRAMLITKSGTVAPSVNNIAMSSATTNWTTFVNTEMQASGVGCDGSPNVNSCKANATTDVGYAGVASGNNLGNRFNNTLPAAISATNVGNSLRFYEIAGSSSTTSDPTNLTAFQNSGGFATWNLSTSGVLTYVVPTGTVSEVPLPAAIWLLMSGLAGFGVVSRRRTA